MLRPGRVKFAAMAFAGTALILVASALLLVTRDVSDIKQELQAVRERQMREQGRSPELERVGIAGDEVAQAKGLAVVLTGVLALVLALIAGGLWRRNRQARVVGVIACVLLVLGGIAALIEGRPRPYAPVQAFGPAAYTTVIWVLTAAYALSLAFLLGPSARAFFSGAAGSDLSTPDMIGRLERMEDRESEWAKLVVGDLERSTGQRLGNDPAAWRAWWDSRRRS